MNEHTRNTDAGARAGIYSIREDHNGRWILWSDDQVVSAGLRLGPAIKLARLLVREQREKDQVGSKIELVSCGHTIDVDDRG
ncbi:hypothetical protein [Dyella koreensis]|uniref:DUF2188 domain-containing protein n=1 Tax=Dyella koreensis TaxID=311235 RepID=A0ABW8K9F6_9GAMM